MKLALNIIAPAVFFALALGRGDAVFAEGHGAQIAPSGGGVSADAKVRGIELGEFQVRSYYPAEAQKSRVRFVLYAAAPAERFNELQQIVETHRHKLRDQIVTATRLAPLTVFDDPELKRFRRLIVMRLRRSLPELEIDDVFVSDFQLVVQNL